MEQLELFTSMNESLQTQVDTLHNTIWYMKDRTILPHMSKRWEVLKAEGKHVDALALAKEFVL
tara:strand:- start:49 stop:237 length:189 start_codon:yes stop_codon:yes gene_type:complete